MGRLGETLRRRRERGEGSLLTYLMAGSVPSERFLACVRSFRAAGVTGMEVGFPFSDPMAEGPVIQRAATMALDRGTRWTDLLELLPRVAEELPVAVMTYLNPILRHGGRKALEELRSHGADAVILPDLPLEGVRELLSGERVEGLDLVLLASPATGEERLRRLARHTQGFLYLVSRYGTTGLGGGTTPSTQTHPLDLTEEIRQVHAERPRLPVLAGFGVRDAKDVRSFLDQGADGAIVGSLLQDRLNEKAEVPEIDAMVRSLVEGLVRPSN
jgi:tryptophan synthase alpha chain